MEYWQSLLQESITQPAQLQQVLGIAPEPLRKVMKTYPMRINPYYLDLIKESERPVIFAGGGIILSRAAAELTEFARKPRSRSRPH